MGTDQLEDANWADKPIQEAPINGYSPNQSPVGKMPSLWLANLSMHLLISPFKCERLDYLHNDVVFLRISSLSYKQTPP